MSEANKRLAERFHNDIFVAGNLNAADEILTPDFFAHPPVLPDFARGPEGVKRWATFLRSGVSELWIEHPHILAEGDLVLIRWRSGGLHTGELFGRPATGKTVTTSGFDLFRISNGRIAELWQEWDSLGWMQQIGAIPVLA